MTKVMIHPATYESVRPAVDRAFELFPLEFHGKKVLIKPNVLRASGAEEGIATHPAMVRAVVEKVETMGPASIIVGDNPGIFGYGANEECFRRTGLTEAAKGYYQNIGNDSQKVDFNPDFMSVVSLSRAVTEADIIISLPKFKTHGLTVITGAIKNSYGLLFNRGKGPWNLHLDKSVLWKLPPVSKSLRVLASGSCRVKLASVNMPFRSVRWTLDAPTAHARTSKRGNSSASTCGRSSTRRNASAVMVTRRSPRP